MLLQDIDWHMPNKKQSLLKLEVNNLLIIAFGAVPGALIRWQVDNHVLVNILGSTILGFLVGWHIKRQSQLLWGVGFCGSLTTFSSWIISCLDLAIRAKWIDAAFLLLGTLGIGLCSAALGLFFGRFLSHLKLFQ